MNKLELIGLEKLENHLYEIQAYIKENKETPERQVQHVLPFMQRPLTDAFNTLEAILENHQTKNNK